MTSTNEIDPAQDPTMPRGSSDFDWTVVIDPLVATALKALLPDWRMKKCWNDFPAAHRRLHIHILQTYLKTGDAPAAADLDAELGPGASAALVDLADRDLVVLSGGEIIGAYPFTSRACGHSVVIKTREIATMCAIDAFGVGAMVDSDAQVHSRCPECDTAIDIRIGGNGLSIDTVRPEGAVVWAGVDAVEGCAADTQCRSMLLFCSDAHLQAWRAKTAPGGEGFRLTPDQALQAGAAIFRPFMAGLKEQESRARRLPKT